MAPIILQVRTLNFRTEQGVSVPARHTFLTAQFRGLHGQTIPYPAFVDTGAAYSVVPHTLAQRTNWKRLGAQLLFGGVVRAIEWNGVRCEMGELQIEVVDVAAKVRTRPLKLMAKVATQFASANLEQSVILGMNFVTDNGLRFDLDATQGSPVPTLWL